MGLLYLYWYWKSCIKIMQMNLIKLNLKKCHQNEYLDELII